MLSINTKKAGKQLVCGTGTLVSVPGKCAVQEFIIDGRPCLQFVLAVEWERIEAPDKPDGFVWNSQKVVCRFRGNGGNASLYALVKDMKRGQRLDIKGRLREKTTTDADGMEIVESFIAVESLIPAELFAEFIMERKVKRIENMRSAKKAVNDRAVKKRGSEKKGSEPEDEYLF